MDLRESAMKAKKPGYSIYSPNTFNFKKLMLKAGHKELKKASFYDIARIIFESPVSNNLDKHLLVAEVLWNQSRKVVFPGDPDFFASLLKSRFALDAEATLNLPYPSFILAMPKGFEVEGVSIPSVIINYNKGSERKDRYNLASKLMGIDEMGHVENNLLGNDSLSFFYQDPYEDKGVIVQVNQTPMQIASALQAKNAEEYAEILGKIPKDLISPIALDTSSVDAKIQFVLTRIIAGISVYMSAKNMSELESGLPNNGHITINNYKPELRYSFNHLPSEKRTGDVNKGDGLGVRKMHFRQLRAPIYYQNQYKLLKPGSRWVFVSEGKLGNYDAEHIG
jgi:hypothetical protein